MSKNLTVDNLSIFGIAPLFEKTKSTSNLVQPDLSVFLKYSRIFYDQNRYTNNGPVVRLLEQRLAKFHHSKYCVTFCSGFWALVLAMRVLAIEGKTEILMPSLTYRRMADIATWARLTPRFYDVNTSTLSARADDVDRHVSNDTALILGVHPIVNCCDVDGLVDLAKDKEIPLLFDSVESVYETVESGKIGTFGEAEVFSLHASKLVNGFEGGYLTTNNFELANKLSIARGFGFAGTENVVVADALNAKLNEMHAAMALASMDDLEEQVVRNRERYYKYRSQLISLPGVRLLEFNENCKTSYKNIVVELLDSWPLSRTDTLSILNSENVLARAYYSPPLHLKKITYPHVDSELPVTEKLSERYLMLPCGHFVDDVDIEKIVNLLRLLHSSSSKILEGIRSQGLKINETK